MNNEKHIKSILKETAKGTGGMDLAPFLDQQYRKIIGQMPTNEAPRAAPVKKAEVPEKKHNGNG